MPRKGITSKYIDAKQSIRFAYPANSSGLHAIRDGDPGIEMTHLVAQHGVPYGHLLVNYGPPAGPQLGAPGASNGGPCAALSTNLLGLDDVKPSDLLVLTTRPPIDDDELDKRRIKASGAPLEEAVFKRLSSYFEMVSRSRVKLSSTLAKQLPEYYEKRADILYYVYSGAGYKRYKAYERRNRWTEVGRGKPCRTGGYLVIEPCCRDRFGLLVAFGMGGTETLLFSALLRRRLWADLKLDLREPRFVYVEMVADPMPDQPLSLDFVDNWKVTTLLNTSDF